MAQKYTFNLNHIALNVGLFIVALSYPSDGRRAIVRHPSREEIELEFINWRSPASIVKQYELTNRASIYRHAHALGLFAKRRRNVRAALRRSSSAPVRSKLMLHRWVQ